ncbi:MAG TPA: 3-isopropylmalate dehydrogenase [Candidatus Hydrogenedentes bacterium]|nr:3-isopropylmalate dehydrogenase [Candidatus Hydrogenedentota bacterium]HOS03562.1 3-isopropylmalate dehydrogenase [Candidatus Hydrogenedentota bacterium]
MYKLAVVPGDGIGAEVTNEALKVSRAVADVEGFTFVTQEYDFGGERYKRTGETLPDSAIEEFKKFSAIYLGAIGHPDVKTGVLEKGILLKIRFSLDQYINLRPVKLYPGVWTPIKDKGPEDIDFIVVRENTESLYVGIGGNFKYGTPDEVALQEMVCTRKGVERCVRYAYELTQKRNRRKQLHLCDKSNVLTYGHDLWQRVFKEVGKEYPDVKQEHAHVDAICMWFVKNPEWFDVIVTDNMFGDIITDLGAMIQGGLGVAAGANINPEGVSMFEPIHGSAPKYAGKNVINPIAAIASAGLMWETLGQPKAAARIENAIAKALGEGHIKTLSAGGDKSTTEIGDLIAKFASA